jgi:hypothetical protein
MIGQFDPMTIPTGQGHCFGRTGLAGAPTIIVPESSAETPAQECFIQLIMTNLKIIS